MGHDPLKDGLDVEREHNLTRKLRSRERLADQPEATRDPPMPQLPAVDEQDLRRTLAATASQLPHNVAEEVAAKEAARGNDRQITAEIDELAARVVREPPEAPPLEGDGAPAPNLRLTEEQRQTILRQSRQDLQASQEEPGTEIDWRRQYEGLETWLKIQFNHVWRKWQREKRAQPE